MNSHVIYTYNAIDIIKKGKTFKANSATELIDTCVNYINTLLSKHSLSPTTQHYVSIPHANLIIFHSHTVDIHGNHHHCHFTLNASTATLRKVCNHFKTLGINKR